MTNISEVIKFFLDKHLIKTVISIVVAIGINLILPNDNWMIEKVGIGAFRVLIFCVSFLILQLIQFLHNQIEIKVINTESEEKSIDCESDEDKVAIEKLRTLADKFSYKDREMIIELITNNNEPILANKYRPYSCGIIKDDHYFYSTKDAYGKEYIKLTDGCFNVYKYIYNKYNMIGHFK